ncbi:MAG: DNA-binding protein [bacterium]|nr:DNA-binding protein [bacterium]
MNSAERTLLKNTNAEETPVEKQFVIDVNIIFSGVLSRKDIYRNIFSQFKLYTPDFAFIELNKYRAVILKKAKKVLADDLRDFTLFLFSKIIVVPDYLISDSAYEKARRLVENVDKKDVAYVALAEELNLQLLTRDKQLYDGLKA